MHDRGVHKSRIISVVMPWHISMSHAHALHVLIVTVQASTVLLRRLVIWVPARGGAAVVPAPCVAALLLNPLRPTAEGPWICHRPSMLLPELPGANVIRCDVLICALGGSVVAWRVLALSVHDQQCNVHSEAIHSPCVMVVCTSERPMLPPLSLVSALVLRKMLLCRARGAVTDQARF